MKILRHVTCTAALVMVLTALSPSTLRAQSVEIVKVDVMAVGQGYRVSKLIGRDAINEQNEKIGEIDDFIIGRDKVLFVILQVGGFLGLGEHLVALPATSVDLETVKGKILIKQANRAQLSKMPQFNYGKDQGTQRGTQQRSSGDSR